MGLENGSLADWASAAGSFMAVVTALYLAGSERRAIKAAQRPELAIENVSIPDERGWTQVCVKVTNHSTKDWEIDFVKVISPRTAIIVDNADCLTGDGGPNPEFDSGKRDANAKRKIKNRMRLSPAGSFVAGRSGDKSWLTFHVKVAPGSRWLKLQFAFASLEPLPDHFRQLMVRALPKQFN